MKIEFVKDDDSKIMLFDTTDIIAKNFSIKAVKKYCPKSKIYLPPKAVVS